MTDHPVTCVIADLLFGEAHKAALHHAIPSVAFCAQSAMTLVAKYYGLRLVDEGIIPFPKGSSASFAKMVTCVSGMYPMKLGDYYSGFWIDNLADPFFQFVVGEQSTSLGQRVWILDNSVFELERSVVEAFQRDASIAVTTIGPLAVDDDSNTSIPTSIYWPEETNCMDWLNKRNPTSVIYVSFGSLIVVTAAVMEAILLGLEDSQVPFLIVMRPDVVKSLDSGFESGRFRGVQERTQDRALLLSWAPQVKILSHPAIAGFLTHCGWNSYLESVSTGVPFLCHPFVLDQPMIGRYMVSVWKAGLEFEKRADGSIDRGDVALAEKELTVRANAMAWKDVARRAVASGGSSRNNLAAFVRDMQTRAGAVN